jgi:hypothetical protein
MCLRSVRERAIVIRRSSSYRRQLVNNGSQHWLALKAFHTMPHLIPFLEFSIFG